MIVVVVTIGWQVSKTIGRSVSRGAVTLTRACHHRTVMLVKSGQHGFQIGVGSRLKRGRLGTQLRELANLPILAIDGIPHFPSSLQGFGGAGGIGHKKTMNMGDPHIDRNQLMNHYIIRVGTHKHVGKDGVVIDGALLCGIKALEY